MNLRFLETFLWVARLNSFSATAERMHTTQAAVSNRIAALERELGVRLFERDLRSVRLTPEGRAALVRAEEIVRLTQEFRGQVADRETLRGRLAIGTIDSVVYAWLPPLIRRIREEYPGVELDLTVDTSLAVAGQFGRNEIDLALIMGPVLAPEVESLPLCRMPCSWYASPALELPPGRLGMTELAEHPVFAFSRGSQPHHEVLRQFAAAGAKAKTLYSLNSISTMLLLAQDGLGVTILPDVVVAGAARGRLRRLDVAVPFPPLEIHAAYNSQPRNLVAARVAQLALEVARGQCGDGEGGLPV
jgi:DNA-binding transcriptional LysR family regulator